MLARGKAPQRLLRGAARGIVLIDGLLHGGLLHGLVWAVLLSFAAACVPAPPTVAPTPLPPSPLPTPSRTPSPLPTSSPAPSTTPESLGRQAVFQDDFSRDRGWQLQQGASGAISLLDQQLVIAVRGPSAILYSISPAPELSDFELEVEVHSEICQDSDEFGVMVRARSLETHYRFTLSCEGAVRASRFIDGREAALAPITASDAALPGAPAVNQLRLEARGDQFRFSVNDILALELSDSQIDSGGTGLFVRARRSSQTTVSFDDFQLWPVGDG